LPTFERPIKAYSGLLSWGHIDTIGALSVNSAFLISTVYSIIFACKSTTFSDIMQLSDLFSAIYSSVARFKKISLSPLPPHIIVATKGGQIKNMVHPEGAKALWTIPKPCEQCEANEQLSPCPGEGWGVWGEGWSPFLWRRGWGWWRMAGCNPAL
jgi:hypothetical protein